MGDPPSFLFGQVDKRAVSGLMFDYCRICGRIFGLGIESVASADRSLWKCFLRKDILASKVLLGEQILPKQVRDAASRIQSAGIQDARGVTYCPIKIDGGL